MRSGVERYSWLDKPAQCFLSLPFLRCNICWNAGILEADHFHVRPTCAVFKASCRSVLPSTALVLGSFWTLQRKRGQIVTRLIQTVKPKGRGHQIFSQNAGCQLKIGEYHSILHIIIWLCLTRTGNYRIHEFDWLKSILTAV